MEHLEWQRLAVHVGAHPAHRHVGVAAFRQHQLLGADLDGRVDDFHGRFLLPVRVLLDLDRRHDRQYVGLLGIHRDLDVMLVRHPLHAIRELVRRDAERAAGLRGALGDLVQFMRDQARLEHAVTRH